MNRHEIDTIRQQHQAGLWPKFIEAMTIAGLRGWSGQTVRFAFPVSAIVGENGTGKSTILKAAACAYTNETSAKYFPSVFFRNTHWDTVTAVSLTYTVREGSHTESFEIKKPSRRWSFPQRMKRRHVFIYDISRTLPLDASAGYARIARLAVAETSTTSLQQEYREKLSHILGREYTNARFATPDADPNRQVGLLTREFGEVSQFHQGAGEDATLDLMSSLQSIPDTSLLLIDEVEASLPPRAQRRLVGMLVELSRTKRLQVVLSTHSPYVLEELPQEARILLMPGRPATNVVYGVSPEFALSRMDDDVYPELHLIVEDREASAMLREILASDDVGRGLIGRVAMVPVGPSNVVKLIGKLAIDGKLPYPAVGVLDGDEPVTAGFVSLPGGQAPERVVFEGLRAKGWPNLTSRFGIGAGDLFSYLEDAMLIPDHHDWSTAVGDRIQKSRTSVWEILVAEWARECLSPTDRTAIVEEIRTHVTG